ncbi:SAM-dependent methyltransferase [Rhodopseudomonas julia]|uniref:SAM-dependent methyltransferase n=1 Tax=Rhodopseudomonas julia TaxID=200617 RepID=A0ABU0CBP9_9BRAD|nr:class I SAM-dependent methyltransferase [Rhodopseudomonas julia]MDQ0327617.1 SAM-dependent methyltransferase [Rhodopseudomonas julia]
MNLASNAKTRTISTWYVDPADEDAMTEAHAPIWRHLIGLLPERDLTTKNVLDFGCNQGGFLRHLYALRPFRKALGVDIATASVEKAESLKGAVPVHYDTDTRLRGWDEQFDVAFTHEVIYLIEDIQRHASDLWRVLKPCGVYYAVTGCHTDNPLWPEWRSLIAGRTNTTVQDRSITDYARAFVDAGFQVSARKLAFDGFVPYQPDGWSPNFAQTLDYYTQTKVVFRLVKP